MKKLFAFIAMLLCISVMLCGCAELSAIADLLGFSCEHEFVWIDTADQGSTPYEECTLCSYQRVEPRTLNYVPSILALLPTPMERLEPLGLDDEQKSVVLTLYYSLMSFEETCVLNAELKLDKLDMVFDVLYMAFPEIMQTEYASTYIYTYDIVNEISFDYTMTQNEYAEAVAPLTKEVKSVVGAGASMSDSEYEKYVYDYIIRNASYKIEAENSGNAYGALISGKAKCDGYASAFSMLMQARGIECYLVPGVALGEQLDSIKNQLHAWNVVKIDGKYYDVDVTWGDDPLNYAYYNLSSELSDKLHSPYEHIKDIVPECDGLALSMPTALGVEIDSKAEFAAALEKYVSEAAERGDKRLFIRYTADGADLESALSDAVALVQVYYGQKYELYRVGSIYVPETFYIELEIEYM